ncbi:MAG: C40 family peptidase [Tannerellaceae bacterium]|jgi:lipoprotein Spr|nr:C40 family peptidase [Tannerellaceae bacterium]
MSRETLYRYIYVAAAVVCLMFASSCGVRRIPAGKNTPVELSRRLGLRVTDKDNLKLYAAAADWMGAPYRFGGASRRGVDCSGFAVIIYKEVYGKRLSASSEGILRNNCKRIKRAGLREGDLVFFRTDGGSKKTPNHVGVYLKNGKFVHASTSRGVVVAGLSEPYYLRAWITGGRVK